MHVRPAQDQDDVVIAEKYRTELINTANLVWDKEDSLMNMVKTTGSEALF